MSTDVTVWRAVRTLGRSKIFSVAAILTVCLGLGANLAILSMFDRALFRPLPFEAPERLVQLHEYGVFDSRGPKALIRAEVVQAILEDCRSFDGLSWVSGTIRSVDADNGAGTLRLAQVRSNLLDVLAIRPQIGRGFSEADSYGTVDPVILSHSGWVGRFGSTTSVLETRWRDGSGRGYQVIGVLPRDFVLPTAKLTEAVDGLLIADRGQTFDVSPGLLTTAPFGRLRPAISAAAAEQEVKLVLGRRKWSQESFAQAVTEGRARVVVSSLRSGMYFVVAPYLWLVTGLSALLFALSTANLTMLVLARERAEGHKYAIRRALGAPTRQLISGPVAEVSALCIAGTAAALAVCAATQSALINILPGTFRGIAVSVFDRRILAFAFVHGLAASIAAAVLPALIAWRSEGVSVLRVAARSQPTRLTTGRILLALQATLTCVLVTAALITVPPFLRIVLQDRGYDPRGLFMLMVNGEAGNGASATVVPQTDPILDFLRAQPDVKAAAATRTVPFGDSVQAGGEFWGQYGVLGAQFAVSSDFFGTLGARFIAGREFSRDEVRNNAPLCVVNEAGRSVLWPGTPVSQVIGRSLTAGGVAREVIGVVSNVLARPGAVKIPALYVPVTDPYVRPTTSAFPILVRTSSRQPLSRTTATDPLSRRLNASLAMAQPVGEIGAQAMERSRFLAVTVGAFTLIGLVLAAVGMYALAAVDASARAFEVALKQACGAAPARIQTDMISRALRPALAGVVGAGAVIWTLGHVLQAGVAGLNASRPQAFMWSIVIVVGLAAVAAWFPIRRAVRTDPVSILNKNV
jgi:putative ABC transport system permease protein